MILLKDALEAMQQTDKMGNPILFSLVFVTYSRDRSAETGRIVEIDQAYCQFRRGKKQKRNSIINVHLPNGQIRSPHIPLITHFNGQRVA
jgi:hypothetical protein